MRKLIALLPLLLLAAPLMAQHRTDFILDVEGAHRTGKNESFTPNTTRFDPRFDNAGGLGVGLNYFLSDRVSVEAKAAALRSNLQVQVSGSDFRAIADLGRAQIYPLSAVLQWHLVEHGSVRPYLGAGVTHVILKNINRQIGNTGANGIHFKDPTGLVIDGGLEIKVSPRWSIVGDARYIPVETRSRATFPGTLSASDIRVRPLIISTGLSWRF